MVVSRAPSLIITGDDFGSSVWVNRAILRAYREGVLTHASLMVNEDAADDAIRIARANPGLGVGLHLSLVLGRASLNSELIPHIADKSGHFSQSPFRAGINYYFSPGARRELYLEMRAQFEGFERSGLPFSHVDGHNHLHMHPAVFEELVRLCAEFNVKRIRIVTSEVTKDARTGRMIGGIFDLLAKSARRRLADHNVDVAPVKVYGLAATGKVDEKYLADLIGEIDPVDSEIYLHPLAEDAPAKEVSSNPNGAKELQALLAPRVRDAIEEKGFALSIPDDHLNSIDRQCFHVRSGRQH